MKHKEQILDELKALGFTLEVLNDEVYHFVFEETHLLYMIDSDDDDFLHLAVPSLFEVTEDNMAFIQEVVNKINCEMKYVKAVIVKDSLWLNVEYQLFGDPPLGELLESFIKALHYGKIYVHETIYGEDE